MIDRLLRFIRVAFWSPRITNSGVKDEARISKQIVQRLSHGNIRLQRGEYITKKDIDKEYERVKSFNFDE